MSTIKTGIDRRSFIKVSAAASGGIVLGFNWLAGCTDEKGEAVIENLKQFDINAFIKIDNLGQVTILSPNPEIGQNVKTAMPMIVAEELDVDWQSIKVEQAPLDTDKYTRQLAGGSQSIRQGWNSLRMAGATARFMFLKAASNLLELDISMLKTENGKVISEQGDEIAYSDLLEEALKQEVPEEVELKNVKDFKIIGHPQKNVDGPEIVAGKPLYGIDFKRDGMLIAGIIHAPAFGMELESFNAEEAKAMSGIIDVIEINPEPQEKTWSDQNVNKKLLAVIGNSTWEVFEAKKKVKANWKQVQDLESNDSLREKLVAAINENTEARRIDGDPDSIFNSSSNIIQSEYGSEFWAHNTMEPLNFFADVREDSADLIGPIQTPENLRASASSLLGIPEEKINVEMTRMGGGFGRRLYGNFALEAAAISQKIGKPIKVMYSREDDMSEGTYRPAYQIRYRAAIDNGEIQAFHVSGAGIHTATVYENRFPAGTLANYRADKIEVDSPITAGAWRAPNSNFVAFAEQSFLDEVAENLEMDPFDLRIKLFEKHLSNPIGEENDYDAERYMGVIKRLREICAWDKDSELSRGIAAYYCHNTYVAQCVDLSMSDGKISIEKVWCVVDCGIVVNPEGAINQLEGSIVDGIGHAMYGKMDFADGKALKRNFDKYRMIRMGEEPKEIVVDFIKNEIDPTGLGEPALPPIMGALANALYRASGKRFRKQPFIDELKSV